MRLDLNTLVEVLKIVTEACVNNNQNLHEARFGLVPQTEGFAKQIDGGEGGLELGLIDNRAMPLLCFYDRDIQSVFRTSIFHRNKKEKQQNETIYKSLLNENATMAEPMLEVYLHHHECQDCEKACMKPERRELGSFIRDSKNGWPTLAVYCGLHSAQGHRSVLEAEFFVYAAGSDAEAFVSTLLAIVEIFCKHNELRLEYKLR